MKTLFLSVAVLPLFFAQESTPTKFTLDQKAPDFKVHTLKGELNSFADLSKDKITVVNFWSSKCPYSVGWEERLTAIYNEYSKKGVQFVMIDSNSTESVADIESYSKTSKIPYSIHIDPRSEVADLFDAKTTPHIYVFDKTRTLRYVGAIDDDAKGSKKMEERKNYLRDALNALIDGKKVETNSTKPAGCSIKRPKA